MTREEAKGNLIHAIRWNDMPEKEALEMAIKALEQEPCEDEYIKVPKKALKYRTVGMVAYNVEWLKNHFDIERAVICGAQELSLKRMDGKCFAASVSGTARIIGREEMPND